MKLTPRIKTSARIASPVLLALLLAVTLLPGAAFATPPPTNTNTPPNTEEIQETQPPATNTQPPVTNTQPPVTNTQPPVTNTQPPQTNTQPPQQTTTPDPAPVQAPHPDAPNYPSADCIVTHAATPAQLCPVAGGLQYYFIGADGSSQAGPYIKPFSELATLYTVGTSVSLFNVTNPFTSKSVNIDYLPSDAKIRVSTYYPDTMYDTDKPYTFTVDNSNSITQEAW